MTPSTIDKLKGVIWGQAVGDAIGLAGEFLSKADIKKHYGKITTIGPFLNDSHRMLWVPGEWTDDTDHMLIVAQSFVTNGSINIHDIADKLYEWAAQGGRGIGAHTMTMFLQKEFKKDPIQTAKRIWNLSGNISAANGALMRGSPVGLLRSSEIDNIADAVAKCTHYDHRCRMSCVVLAQLINALVYGGKASDPVRAATIVAKNYSIDEAEIAAYLVLAEEEDISKLNLDGSLTPNNKAIGFTLKTLSAGLWALNHAESYEEGILSVVNEGGDADTNAAVVGALLGAKYGYSSIPQDFIQRLRAPFILDSICDSIQKLDTAEWKFSQEEYKSKSNRLLNEFGSYIPEKRYEKALEGNNPVYWVKVEVLSLSRLSNLDLDNTSAVISINSPGNEPFIDFQEHTLKLWFSDFDDPASVGTALDKLFMAIHHRLISPLAEVYWHHRSQKKRAVVPFRDTHVEMICQFIKTLPDTCQKLYIHCDYGKSRSVAVAKELHLLFGIPVVFMEADVNPNKLVTKTFRKFWQRANPKL